ncbi:MAG: deoxyribonuclease [Planctomycetota bacterium]|nr:MAG: deoxyribonuclease [Planctomycetota bacterium]
MPSLVDTHCHLAFSAFADDLDAVVERARSAGLVGCVAVAVDPESAEAALALSEQFPGWAHATSGLHPTEAACADPLAWDKVNAQLRGGRFVAVGETGLDRFHDDVPLATQQASLERHLGLAVELDLPVILHCRDAFDELLEQLAPWRARGVRGVLHCFTGDAAHIDRLLELDLHVGVGGIATFKPRDDLRAAVRAVPLTRLLVETDAPWLAPVPHRGRRNEPAYVADVASCLAADRELELEAFCDATTQAARALFNLPSAAPATPR